MFNKERGFGHGIATVTAEAAIQGDTATKK
jgi:hypothetical protein